MGAVVSTWLKCVKIAHMMLLKKLYADYNEEIPKWPHPIMFALAVFAILRFSYCGDFVIHDHTVAPE